MTLGCKVVDHLRSRSVARHSYGGSDQSKSRCPRVSLRRRAPAARSCLGVGHGSSQRNEAFSRFHANKCLQRLADKRCGLLVPVKDLALSKSVSSRLIVDRIIRLRDRAHKVAPFDDKIYAWEQPRRASAVRRRMTSLPWSIPVVSSSRGTVDSLHPASAPARDWNAPAGRLRRGSIRSCFKGGGKQLNEQMR